MHPQTAMHRTPHPLPRSAPYTRVRQNQAR